jgi:ABC-type cobalamin transport system ATPase subunit
MERILARARFDVRIFQHRPERNRAGNLRIPITVAFAFLPAVTLHPPVQLSLPRLLRLRREGLSLLIVEQSTERAMAAADRMYIMRNGEIKFVGRPDNIINRDPIEQAYFGFAVG